MKRLRVWYGWSKINKIQKKEAIEVIFENDVCWRNEKAVSKWIKPVYCRYQTPEEAGDAKGAIRMFTVWYVFMDHKAVKWNLDAALRINYEADKNWVSESERKKIAKLLREDYLCTHRNKRKEPRQLDLFDNI